MDSTTPKSLEPSQLTLEEYQFLMKRPHYDNLLIDSHNLAIRVPLNQPRQWTPAKRPYAGLGQLSRLPPELQLNVIAMTPVSALFDLRRTNSNARQLIEDWPPFRTLMTQGPEAVRALLATGAGNLWTTEQVVDVIFTTQCEFCDGHGEILHLLKLKRCCLRCLSQERELLAVSEAYARNVLKISHENLAKLPNLSILPQKSFWGYATIRRHWIFDYNSVLKLHRDQASQPGSQPFRRPPMPSLLGLAHLSPTGKYLKPEERSVQPRPKSTIQARRGQPTLRLLSEEVCPLETLYVQHACAIRVPAKRRKVTKLPDGGLQTEISTINAVHCAGCAFYWNYHSPLPWQFHRLYPHQEGKVDTEFARHLQHCIYARLQWFWIHNPWRRSHPEDMIQRPGGRLLRTRTGLRPGLKENSRFEEIPGSILNFMAVTNVDSTSFQPQYTWPEIELDDEKDGDNYREPHLPSTRTQRIVVDFVAGELLERVEGQDDTFPTHQPDHFWDCLVSQEAGSQANWASASLWNGKVRVFGGPTAVLVEKWQRLERKYPQVPRIGLWQLYL